jgi:hypothetical protein
MSIGRGRVKRWNEKKDYPIKDRRCGMKKPVYTTQWLSMLIVLFFGANANGGDSPKHAQSIDNISTELLREIYRLNDWVQQGSVNAQIGKEKYQKSRFREDIGYDGKYYFIEATAGIKSGEPSTFSLVLKEHKEGMLYADFTSGAALNREQWRFECTSARCSNNSDMSKGLPGRIACELSSKCAGRYDLEVTCKDPNPLGTGYRVRIYYMEGYRD